MSFGKKESLSKENNLFEIDGLSSSEISVRDEQKFSELRRKYIENHYLKPGEIIFGYGYGGSESLTIFIEKSGKKYVRKILNEKFITPNWDEDGKDVMLPPCSKARSQAIYLKNLEPEARRYFPEVLNDIEEKPSTSCKGYQQFNYDMTFIEGIEISQFIRDYKPSPRTVAMLYSEIFKLLKNKVHSQRVTPVNRKTLEQSYFNKIEQRLALCRETSPATFGHKLQDSDHIIVNGKVLRNVGKILNVFRENPTYQKILEPSFHSLVMGDTNTENIKIGNIQPLLDADNSIDFYSPAFNADSLELKFLDPRAIGFHIDDIDSGRDDPMYDNKPWHNSIGNYDNIHGEHFEIQFSNNDDVPSVQIDFHKDSPYQSSYDGIEKYFKLVMSSAWGIDDPDDDFLKHDPHWLVRFVFVMGTHFMAMPPFHFKKEKDTTFIDTAEHQKRALAIYVEGIKWLNKAINILEGRVDSYLGVHIGDKYRGETVSKRIKANEIYEV